VLVRLRIVYGPFVAVEFLTGAQLAVSGRFEGVPSRADLGRQDHLCPLRSPAGHPAGCRARRQLDRAVVQILLSRHARRTECRPTLPASKGAPVMKLPRLRRKPAPGPAEPASASPAVGPVLQVLIHSSSGLPGQEFSAQTGKLCRVASYDDATRSWYAWIHLDRPERGAGVLTALFEAARVHGTTVRVRAWPAEAGSQPGQAP
jgi:hypothetical protein